ncbi:enoyl-CoA hydratase/isomerase family protein [Chloroflexota bacterium]
MANFEAILYDKKSGVATITLNRPEALNAITRQMFIEIGQALDDAEIDNSVSVVVMKGSGQSFCAGVDLKFATEELKTLQDEQDLFRLGNKMALEKMEGLSKPVIASVHGYCMAGGFEMMLASDLVIAAEDAVISDQHINVGLFGGGGCVYRLALLVGIRRAKEIVLTGKRLSGKEAEQLGIVNHAVPAGKLDKSVAEMAATLSEKSPVAMKLSKWYINKTMMVDADIRLELAIMYSLIDSTSEDKEEGMRAFVEKRKPVFKGR